MADGVIDSVDALHRLSRANWSRRVIYRGEVSTRFELRPKFGRYLAEPFSTDGASFPERSSEQAMLWAFQQRAPPYLSQNPQDEWDWLAIAQHHGLATRLLDWTTNILVAAFFASDCARAESAVLYALDTSAMTVAQHEPSPFSIAQTVIYHPRHATLRISAQSGLFTCHADPATPFNHPALERFVLHKDALVDIYLTLRTYDIHRARLFPGLDSLAAHINHDYACASPGR